MCNYMKDLTGINCMEIVQIQFGGQFERALEN